MSELDILKRKRASLKSKLTLFKNYLTKLQTDLTDNQMSEQSIRELQDRTERISILIDDFDQVQLQIESLVENIEEQLIERENFETVFFNLTSTARQLAADKSKLVYDSIPNDIQSQLGESIAASMGAQCVKLPTIQLPKFEGQYESWLEYRDTFESLIHTNVAINSIQKFHYLRASLSGGAAQVIKSLEFSAANYEIAWNILCDRYNNTKLLINNHVKALFTIEPITKESSYKLRQMIDTVSKHLRALQTLKEPVEQWDTLVVYLITTKLDAVTAREWEQRKERDVPTLEDLKQFLKGRADLLETLEFNRSDRDKKQFRTKDSRTSNSKSFVATNIVCEFCKKDHYIQNCDEFLKLDANKRIEQIIRLKLCLNCLRRGHYNKDCQMGNCRRCSKKHNTLLHLNRNNKMTTDGQTNSDTNTETASVALSSRNLTTTNQVLLSTALVKVLDKTRKEHNARVLLDAGSQSSFMTSDLCKLLNLPKTNINITIGGFNQKTSNINQRCEAEILSRNKQFQRKISCLVVSKITGDLPNFRINRLSLSIPANIRLADPKFDEPGEIDVLLGADCFFDLLSVGQFKPVKDGPTLQKTKLGWVLAGPINMPTNFIQCNFNQDTIPSLDNQLVKFWEIENCPNTKILSEEERFCEEHFVNNTVRDNNGRFVVTIPFKKDISNLGDSKTTARNRLLSLERKLQNDNSMRIKYNDFMREYEALGHMHKVCDDNSNSISYYMPHHGVKKEDSLTTKLRIVFDGSAATTTGYSINNLQMVGPTIQPDLFSILIRFRRHNYAFCADIEKMYRQVKINPEQYCLQRILWRTDKSKPIDTYELKTVTYGTASASFLAIRSLYQLGIEAEDKHPQVARIIKSDFYVDDLISGADTIDTAIDLSLQVSQTLEKGCFKLRKWISNESKIESILSSISNDSVLNMGSNENTKTLGLYWFSKNDELFFSISENSNRSVTKRTILSDISQIFDPLGLLSPSIIIAKILLQSLWLEKLSWDESLPLSLQTKWNSFRDELVFLNNIRINRQAFCKNFVNVQLHGFSDSSSRAFGACVFVRSEDRDGNIFVNLLTAKSKVAPVKTITIPRLELCAALVLAQLVNKVQTALDTTIDSVTYWTDSSIVLGWLNISPNKLQTFVGNRVAQIQEISKIKCWRHVSSHDNPADHLSRGVNPKNLENLRIWWHGPNWLEKDESYWPSLNFYDTDGLPEMKIIHSNTVTIIDKFSFERFSCFFKMKRIVGYCFRFKHNCLNSKNKIIGPLTVDELNKAEIQLIKIAQSETFSDDLICLQKNKSEKINKNILGLNPFLDNNNIIRVGGRLKNSNFCYDKKHPILLSAKHKFSKLLFLSEHKGLLHAGPQLLLSSIQQRYWPLGGRNLARKVVHDCVRCFKAKPNSITPMMGDLPAQRLTPSPPFYRTGVDYAGPMLIKDRQGRGCKVTKAYIAVFVCFVTKAIHLELVSSLSTECFIAALNRFTARRGKPFEIFSDNGKNFVGANSELQELGTFLNNGCNDLKEIAENDGIRWHFIPPNSPHFGGLWEAGVKSTKFHLKRVAGNALLTFEQLYTLLVKVEAILNSRPLFPTSTDPNDLSPITPAHFLIGRELTSVAVPDFNKVPENRLSSLQRVEQLRQHFWSRWNQEYVSQLQQRSKWKINCGSLTEGALVLIKEENLPPLKWKLGRIVELHRGNDGIARVATVRTVSGNIKRSFSKICPLPKNDATVSNSVSEVKKSTVSVIDK